MNITVKQDQLIIFMPMSVKRTTSKLGLSKESVKL